MAVPRLDPTASPEAIQADPREDVRTWLRLVKAVLPMEREVNRMFQHEFAQSLPRFDVLSQLERSRPGGHAVGVLAEHLIASAGNITRLVSRMADEGLVHRTMADGDRRRQIVAITDKGLALYRTMEARHTQWCVDRLTGLSPEEKTDLQRLLKKVRATRPKGTENSR